MSARADRLHEPDLLGAWDRMRQECMEEATWRAARLDELIKKAVARAEAELARAYGADADFAEYADSSAEWASYERAARRVAALQKARRELEW